MSDIKYDEISLNQLKNIEQDEKLRIAKEQLDILAKHLNALELLLNRLSGQVDLLEKDRHTHLPSQLEPKGEVKQIPKLSDWLKKLGL